jgi:predicted nucleic acid-binding protein
MLAVDTNLVVRYLYDDDPRQCRLARAVIDGDEVLIATTVLLETAWVLRGAHGKTREEIAAGLRRLAGLPTVRLQDPDATARAIELAEQGVDVADAFHLAATEQAEAFITFDQRLQKAASRLGVRVRSP